MGRVKCVISQLSADELTHDTLEEARLVVARAQQSVVSSAATMFWINFHTSSFFIGSIGAIFLALACTQGFCQQHHHHHSHHWMSVFLLSWRCSDNFYSFFVLAVASFWLLEWVYMYMRLRLGFSHFANQRVTNPIVRARDIFNPERNDKRNKFFVARFPSSRKICGAALMICGHDALTWHSDIPASMIDPNSTAIVRYVGVDPQFQGHGVGCQMMHELLRAAKAAKAKASDKDETKPAHGKTSKRKNLSCASVDEITEIVLHTTTMMRRAIQMYEGLGFVVVKRTTKNRLVGYDELVMRLQL